MSQNRILSTTIHWSLVVLLVIHMGDIYMVEVVNVYLNNAVYN